jgi:hypothetical protein
MLDRSARHFWTSAIIINTYLGAVAAQGRTALAPPREPRSGTIRATTWQSVAKVASSGEDYLSETTARQPPPVPIPEIWGMFLAMSRA